MRKLGLLLAIFCSLQTIGQPYYISFSGIGLSTVKVQNLTTGVIVDVLAGDVLHLSTTTNIQEVINLKSSGLKIYPNPMIDKSTLVILPPVAGKAIITIYDMTGKVLTQFKDYLDNYAQEFSLSDIKNGLYIINVQANGYYYSTKILSTGRSNSTGVIARKNNNTQKVADKKAINDLKGFQNSVDMTYNAGERIKFTAVSGNNSTVITDIPTADKTVTFSFTECKDGDNNYYPVVQIGTQLWMAENLKTTKFISGNEIPIVTDNVNWKNSTIASFCWYLNNESTHKSPYGALYNYYAIISNAICPNSWHVPSDSEWTIVENFMGGATEAGGKLKETGLLYWNSPNMAATNESGFTARAGGLRNSTQGQFIQIGFATVFWSSTYNNPFTIVRIFDYGSGMISTDSFFVKTNGASVRCLKDQ